MKYLNSERKTIMCLLHSNQNHDEISHLFGNNMKFRLNGIEQPPKIKITKACISQNPNSNINLFVFGNVSDRDERNYLNVEGLVDNNNGITASQTINVKSMGPVFFLNFSIPKTFNTGYHTISVRVEDSMFYEGTDSGRFNIDYCNPSLALLKSPGSPIYINKDEKIQYKLRIKDATENAQLIFYHKINKSNKFNILNKTLLDYKPVDIDYNISIPRNATPGNYEISIYVENQHKRASYPLIINATFAENSPIKFKNAFYKQRKFGKYLAGYHHHELLKLLK